MIENKSLDLSNQIILYKIEEKVLSYLNKQLGTSSIENKDSYRRQQKEALWLLQNKKEYLLPKGRYVLTDEVRKLGQPVEQEDIMAQFIVVLSCKEYKTDSITEGFLIHLLQISYLNAVREYIKESLLPGLYEFYFQEKAPFVTTYYGPGLFEQPLETMKSMVELVGADQMGVAMKGDSLYPACSFVGSLYVTRKRITQEIPCKKCKAQIGCEYCMIRQAR
ncbi:MAG: hypothetical protein Q4G58_02595 [bacterium]|nr:hypothetical protein [bacterium]